MGDQVVYALRSLIGFESCRVPINFYFIKILWILSSFNYFFVLIEKNTRDV